MSKSFIPDHIGTIFDPDDYRNNDEYVNAEGVLATSTALVTNFTGEIDIRENLEFTGSEPVNNYIANVNKITFKDSIADQTIIKQEVDGLHITSSDIVLNNLPIKATIDDISQNVTDLQNQATSYDLSINLIQIQSDRQDTSLNTLKGLITDNYDDITGLDNIVAQHDTSLNEIKSIANTKTDETYVDQQINNLINSAPLTLDTLNEIATSLNNDPDFYNTMNALVQLKTDVSDHNLVVDDINAILAKDIQIDTSLNNIITNIRPL